MFPSLPEFPLVFSLFVRRHPSLVAPPLLDITPSGPERLSHHISSRFYSIPVELPNLLQSTTDFSLP